MLPSRLPFHIKLGSKLTTRCLNFQDFPDNGSSSYAGDAEEYLFTSGQTTPRGSRTDQPQTSDAMWTAARTVSSAPRMSHAMSRANSSRSSGSCMSQSSSHLSSMDSTGNASALRNGPQPAGSIAGMDSCLLLDADAAAVPHIYCSISRTSSPATIDDTWLSAPLSPHSSPDLKCQSPSPERKLSMIPEDRNGLAGSQLDDSGLSQALAARRQAVDGESARDHALYKNATINVDGLFHCPWEGQPNCNHKPEKLKCNYDKFVDSHLKPYRCKADSCEGARFSSTACLLRRHEREAHGLHGHGDKPYLCVYEGCERAVPGNGFPRQWNLRDHMKRVHNDHRTAAGSPPSAAGAQSAKGRKRKTDVPEPQTAASRKATVKSMPVAEPVQSSRPLLEQWMDHRRVVEDMVRGLSKPEDSRSLQQITEVQKRLSVMAKMTTELTAMPKLEVFPALGRKSYVSG
ncbi:hypothetical protein G6O67_003954 [Ophiocordyceps sinensis]|uniref:C2H2-type domain-containing protein n=1 Tax=Ophiocordyceps sinensis TaxID=72228 RepID=A0A8H4LYK3_9HYPO|nr:hypothetical protein G6O67_003954 [Ophiocordyceps sinensis]